MVSPDKITKEEFTSLLDRYPQLINTLSQAKPPKNGQKSLLELDEFRYVEAPSLFNVKAPQREMDLEDVKTLVEWKLKHGKFRPTLLSLVTSNPPSQTTTTVQSALKTYLSPSPSTSTSSSPPKKPSNPTDDALATLTKLRGVGPATASLLLSVHDPARVPFFSDEAFLWLCRGGVAKLPAGTSIKYSPGEYAELRAAATALAHRLDVAAVEIEKVAYVVMKSEGGGAEGPEINEQGGTKAKGTKAKASSQPKELKEPKEKEKQGQKTASKPSSVKRKSAEREDKLEATKGKREDATVKGDDDQSGSLRRSKRLRK